MSELHSPLHPYSELPFLIVSGQARSGTTVLTRAIAEHPQIDSNGKESNYVRDIGTMVQLSIRPARLSQLSVPPEKFVEIFRQATLNALFPVANLPGDRPSCCSTFSSLRPDSMDALQQLFPNLMIANIVRNGVEVVASRMAHKSIGARSFEEHCRAWAAARAMTDWGRGRPNCFEVQHHELLSKKETSGMFQRLFQQFGLNDDEAPTEFVHRGLFNTTQSENESETAATDLSQRKERWRSWTGEQREMFETICGPVMQHFGFEIPWRRK